MRAAACSTNANVAPRRAAARSACLLLAALVLVCLAGGPEGVAPRDGHGCGTLGVGDSRFCQAASPLPPPAALPAVLPSLERPAAARMVVTRPDPLEFVPSPASPVTPRSPPLLG